MKAVLTFLACTLAFSSYAKDLQVGDPAPHVRATNEFGQVEDLQPAFEKELVLIYFYPKAGTPGCTAQACSLRDAYSKLSKMGLKIYGVSTDSVEAQRKFKDEQRLPFHLLSDPKGDVAAAFGVGVAMGFMSRQAFLIEKGQIIWLDRKASTKEQAADVLKVLESRAKSKE